MRRLQTLNLGQRIVLVIALAGVLSTVGSYTVKGRAGEGGWFAYTPLMGEGFLPFADQGWHPVPAALLWVALIALWAAASVWLLGGRR